MLWSDNNLIPAWNNSSWSTVSGGASISVDGVNLPANSVERVILKTSEALKGSSAIKVYVQFSGTFSIDNMYTPKSYISVRMKYMDGSSNSIRIILDSNNSIGENKYSDVTEVTVGSGTIDSIYLDLVNYGDSTVNISKIELYKSEDINTDQLGEALADGVQLASLKAYEGENSCGCIATWKNDSVDTHIQFVKNTSGGLGALLVNGKDLIPFERVYEDLPKYVEQED